MLYTVAMFIDLLCFTKIDALQKFDVLQKYTKHVAVSMLA